MPNILTPLSVWESFNSSLSTSAVVLSSREEDGIVYEKVNFSGRDTGMGRVTVAAEYAYSKKSPSAQTVIILPDSDQTIDDEMIKMFVQHGYSALMVDYRGKWDGCKFCTHYPDNVEYANTKTSGRHYGFVDDSARETSWYEWVAVGAYARKYAIERSGSQNVAVVGIRDGGEIAWKLAVVEKFSCIIPVCAAGWRAYFGISKYLSVEPDLNEERYRFIAGIDSQAYAPYVKCPVLMISTTNDEKFDYDRAHDTFSRINREFSGSSAIAYSTQCNNCIGPKCTADMFMFLDKNLKNRQVFIPKPADIVVGVDDESNLIARAIYDDQGIVESCGMYIAEDCIDSSLRDWTECPPKTKGNQKEQQFYLNICENTNILFVLCYIKYINGFTVWSKMVAKKISGKFRNMRRRSRVIYSDKDGSGGFTVAEPKKCGVASTFLPDESVMPALKNNIKGVKGLYTKYGLTTYKFNNPRFAPAAGNVLKLDICCDASAKIFLRYYDANSKEEYVKICPIVGGVWQSIIAECNDFKNSNGTPLTEFTTNSGFSITCEQPFAVNNVMWL